jgi:hypothetical protein
MVTDPRWELEAKTVWPTDRQSQNSLKLKSNTRHKRKNDPPIWNTEAHARDHTPKDSKCESENTALIMTIPVRCEAKTF